MSAPRYFLPEHPTLKDVYSKTELRAMLQAGDLSRSDMVTDDETGIAYLLGDLLAMPFRDAAVLPARSTTSLQPVLPTSHEFRADTPLPRVEREGLAEEETEEMEEEQEEEGMSVKRGGEEWEDKRVRRGGYGERGAVEDEEEQEEDQDQDQDQDQEEEQEDGEEERLLYVGHPSWLAFPKSLFITAVCIGSGIFFQQHNVRLEWITLLGSIAGLIVLFIGLDRMTTTYLVTTKRVEMEFGIIGRNTKEVRIGDIRAIDVVQRGFSALLGIGTVKFDSSASAGPEVCFRNVRRAHEIKHLVRELQG
jgi:hypothetical protein